MKGLFVKDFKLLTSGGNYFIVVFVLTAFGALCMAADGEYPGDVGFESVLIAAAAVEAKVYDLYCSGHCPADCRRSDVRIVCGA